jgi:cytochrome b
MLVLCGHVPVVKAPMRILNNLKVTRDEGEKIERTKHYWHNPDGNIAVVADWLAILGR